jgi:hypothetical protein
MGGRINVLLAGLSYANEYGRDLIVDWSDGYYGSDADTIRYYFKNDFIFFGKEWTNDVGSSKNLSCSIYPEGWSNDYFRQGHLNVDGKLYMLPPPPGDRLEDIVVITWVSNNLPDSELSKLAVLLRPVDEILNRVDDLLHAYHHQPFIGVHYRHGNGESGVICPEPEWFDHMILSVDPSCSMPILLCTDSIHSENYFEDKYGNRIIHSNKIFPAQGPLHNNREILNKRANGIDALVDMYSLSRSQYFIDSGEFFGKTAWLLGAGARGGRYTYPGKTRMFNSQGSQYPGGVKLLKSNAELADSFGMHKIRLDNLFYKEVGAGLVELWYGSYALCTFDPAKVDEILRVCNVIKKRRLYV